MDEVYSRHFKSPPGNSFSDDIDPFNLYVRQIPTQLTHDEFLALMIGDVGRRVQSIFINRRHPHNVPFTYGFASFASHEEALDALDELNGTPPLYLEVNFANKKIENEEKVYPNFSNMQYASRGRGFSMTSVEPHYEVNVRTSNTHIPHMPSKGRGLRIDLDGLNSVSNKIRVTAGGEGRKVSVGSSPKKNAPEVNGQFSNDESPSQSTVKSPEKPVVKKTDEITPLILNPFLFCYCCGKEGRYSCSFCKKPYCSRRCQAEDLLHCPDVCKKAQKVADTLLQYFNEYQIQSNDSSYMSENSNSDHEKPNHISAKKCKSSPEDAVAMKPNKDATPVEKLSLNPRQDEKDAMQIEKLSLNPRQVEKVSVISDNIQSPSRFRVRLNKFSQDFLNMERKLTSLQKELAHFHSTSLIHPHMYVCVLYNGKICRAKVFKVKSESESMIYLLDYGKSVTVQKSALYKLPDEFRSLPAQAVNCQLVGAAGNENVEWNNEDNLSFQLYITDKNFKAQFHKCNNNVYDVSLLDEDGVSLYTILKEAKVTEINTPSPVLKEAKHTKFNTPKLVDPVSKEAKVTRINSPKSVDPVLKKTKDTENNVTKSVDLEMDGPPPSVWLKLKPGIKMTLLPSILNNDYFWCYLSVDGGSDLGVILEMEKLLQNYSGKDIALSAEEGDFAAGFSREYKQYYRCVILKRKRDSFHVRYIDYGNEEDITCLKLLSNELYGKCCHILKCEKPSSLTVDEFQNFFDSGREVSVVEVNKNAAVISFNCDKQYSMTCYPCYPHSEFEDEIIDKVLCAETSNNSISKPQTRSDVDFKIIADKIMTRKVLSLTKMYSVKILFIKTVSELYIQFAEDEDKMMKMVTNLNNFCNSRNKGYTPKIGEIVSCKFSDGVWYRGQVKEKLNCKYRIFFIDYGNEDIVPENSIQVLPEKFRATQFSICVALSGIRNEDVSKCLLSKLLEEEWDMKVIDEKKVPFEVILLQKGCPLTKMIEKQTDKRDIEKQTDKRDIEKQTNKRDIEKQTSKRDVEKQTSERDLKKRTSKRDKSLLLFQKLPSETTVKICFEDDKYLYVNQEKDLKSLEEMSAKLNSLSELSTPKKPLISNVYCGLFVDGLWYRVTVEEEVSDDKYKVFFIDFGNYENISLCDLRDIPDDLFALPVYCIPVVVDNRKELTLTMEDTYPVKVIGMQGVVQKIKILETNSSPVSQVQIKSEGKSKSCLFFKNLSAEEPAEVKLCHEDDKYIYLHQTKDLPIVEDLFVKINSTSELPVVTKPIINNIYCGLFSDGAWYRVSVEEMVSSDTYKVYFLDYGNYETLTTTNLRELPNEISSFPVCCIPVILEKRNEISLSLEKLYIVSVVGKEGEVQKVKFIEPEFETPSKFMTKSVEENDHLLKYQKLPSDVSVEVQLCHEDENYLYLQQVKDLKTLEEMMLKLLSLPESPSVKKPIVKRIYSGLSNDGLCYRVSVKEELSANTFKVLYLDYGNFDNLSCNNLRELPDEFFDIPVFSVPVVVENRKELKLNMEKQYTVKVTGMEGNCQRVKFLFPEEAPEMPHISALKKQSLEKELNEVVPCFMEGDMMFCQLSSDSDKVKDVFKALQQCGREGQVPSFVSVGDVVCAQSSDSFWYRACVLSNKKAPSYKVLFFDYGNSEFITGDCIKILSRSLLEFPIFAMPMKINNLAKITDTSIFAGPLLVKKLKMLEDDKYLVEVQTEADSSLPKISDLETITLPSDCVSNVTICNVEDTIYYVQPTSNANKLTELQVKLLEADTFSNLSDTPVKDDVICAKFSDGVWYRSAVQEVLGDKSKVCFIDFGNCDLVSLENTKILPAECCSYAIACVPAKFKDDSAIIKKISEDGITPFNVRVCGKVDNIQVLDIVPDTEDSKQPPSDPPVSIKYDPVFLSSLKISPLPLMESCKVVFKHHYDNFSIVVKSDDTLERENLNVLIEKTKTDAVSHLISVNEILLVKNKNGLWHRCCVLEADTGKDIYKVYFVDLGITESVQKCALRYLPENIMSFPQFAIKVSIEPKESVVLEKSFTIVAVKQNTDGIYSVKLYQQYRVSSLTSKELYPGQVYQVMFCHKEGGKLYLQDTTDAELVLQIQNLLLECSSNSSIPYQPEVGELVCAKSKLDNSWYRGCIKEVLSADKYNIFFIDYGNCEVVQKSDLQAFPLTLTKFPLLCVPVKFADERIIENIELEKLYSVTAESKTTGDVQIIKFVERNNEETNKEISSVEPVCSAKSSEPSKKYQKFFFTSCKHVPFTSGEQNIAVYNVDEEGYLFCAPYDQANIEANLSLPAQLTEHCNTKGIPFKDCEPELNEMVLALFPEDNNWYRATVIDKSHPTYDVNFVDYGNTESLDISNLRVMEEQFMKLEIQAHMCLLTGHVVPAENMEKVYQELKKFIIFVNPEPIKAHVKIIDGEVTAFIPQITSLLVNKSLATAVDKN